MTQLEQFNTNDNAPEVIRKSNILLENLRVQSRVTNQNNAVQFRGTINNALQSAPNLQQFAIEENHNAVNAITRLNQIKQAIEGGQTPDPENPELPTLPEKLNILVLGNSHSEDSWAYVPFILSKLNIDYFIVLALHRGEYLYNYVDNWENGGSAGRIDDVFYLDSAQVTSGWQEVFKDNNGNRNWHPQKVLELRYSDLKNTAPTTYIPWNIVSIQPFYDLLATSRDIEKTRIVDNIDYIYNKVKNIQDCVLGLTIESTSVYMPPSLTVIKEILKSQQARNQIDIFFPVGPTIFNLRYEKAYRYIKSSYKFRNLAADGAHLAKGIGDYAGACAVVQGLLNYYSVTNKSLSDSSNNFEPNSNFFSYANIPWGTADMVAGYDTQEQWNTNKGAAHLAAQNGVNKIQQILASDNINQEVTNWNVPSSSSQNKVIVKAVGCTLTFKYNGTQYTCPDGGHVDIYVPMYTQSTFTFDYPSNCTTVKESSRIKFDDEYGVYNYPNPNSSTSEGTASLVVPVPSNGKFTRTFNNICTDYEYSIINGDSPTPQDIVNPEYILLNKNNITLTVGDQDTLVPAVYPSNTTDKSVTWTSSNTAIATVSNNGVVTAIAVGECTITATCQNVSATCTVTVQEQSTPGTPSDPIEFTVNGVSFNMVPVEGGTILMGSPTTQTGSGTNERPQYLATVSDYYIGQTPVTQELWQAVKGSNPSSFTGNLQRPVERVTWDACQGFISDLNALTGRQFRLPTEAEWEYAAKGGNQSNGYIFAGSNTPGSVAWYSTNSSSKTQPVAQKAPNELGIYDMSGNVQEWCSDWFISYEWYTNPSNFTQPVVNPTGPTTGSNKTLRGGSWFEEAKNCRSGYRKMLSPSLANASGTENTVGFRLALTN